MWRVARVHTCPNLSDLSLAMEFWYVMCLHLDDFGGDVTAFWLFRSNAHILCDLYMCIEFRVLLIIIIIIITMKTKIE